VQQTRPSQHLVVRQELSVVAHDPPAAASTAPASAVAPGGASTGTMSEVLDDEQASRNTSAIQGLVLDMREL